MKDGEGRHVKLTDVGTVAIHRPPAGYVGKHRRGVPRIVVDALSVVEADFAEWKRLPRRS